MHAVFIPYGERESIERFFRQLEAQMYPMPFRVEDVNNNMEVSQDKEVQKQEGLIYIRGAIRLLPFGAVEYIFPQGHKDAVLHTLGFTKEDHYGIGWKLALVKTFMRKFLKIEKTPEIKEPKKLVWAMDNVNIIPLGVRYDDMNYKDINGTIHEGL